MYYCVHLRCWFSDSRLLSLLLGAAEVCSDIIGVRPFSRSADREYILILQTLIITPE